MANCPLCSSPTRLAVTLPCCPSLPACRPCAVSHLTFSSWRVEEESSLSTTSHHDAFCWGCGGEGSSEELVVDEVARKEEEEEVVGKELRRGSVCEGPVSWEDIKDARSDRRLALIARGLLGGQGARGTNLTTHGYRRRAEVQVVVEVQEAGEVQVQGEAASVKEVASATSEVVLEQLVERYRSKYDAKESKELARIVKHKVRADLLTADVLAATGGTPTRWQMEEAEDLATWLATCTQHYGALDRAGVKCKPCEASHRF